MMGRLRSFAWSIFGNNEEYPPPSWYYERHYPGKWKWAPEWLVRAAWLFQRNPLHNLKWHLLGMASRRHLVHYDHVFNPKGGLNIVLPFVSYESARVKFYLGWRPDSGALGAKFNIRGGR